MFFVYAPLLIILSRNLFLILEFTEIVLIVHPARNFKPISFLPSMRWQKWFTESSQTSLNMAIYATT